MEEKEVITQGEAFERLFANEDFKVLQEFIQGEIQSTSSVVLGPDGATAGIHDFSDYKKAKGILLGLATPQSYMENIIKRMKEVKEERQKAELEKKKLEEAKRARTE